jgi:hypothetical protein
MSPSLAAPAAPRDAPSAPRRSARRAILLGGLITGALDITAAFVLAGLRGIGPVRIFHGIAEALLGAASQRGGAATAVLGLLMHFSIATFWTALFYFLSRRLPILVERPWVFGPLYGALVFILMYRVAIPLVLALNALYLTEFDPTVPPLRLRQLVVHLVCVGLPIALAVRRFGPPPRRPAADGTPQT